MLARAGLLVAARVHGVALRALRLEQLGALLGLALGQGERGLLDGHGEREFGLVLDD